MATGAPQGGGLAPEPGDPARGGGAIGGVFLAIGLAQGRLLIETHEGVEGGGDDDPVRATPQLAKSTAWPKIRAVTATYIGLRTKR